MVARELMPVGRKHVQTSVSIFRKKKPKSEAKRTKKRQEVFDFLLQDPKGDWRNRTADPTHPKRGSYHCERRRSVSHLLTERLFFED